MQLAAWRLPAARRTGQFPAEEVRGGSSMYFIFRMPEVRVLNARWLVVACVKIA